MELNDLASYFSNTSTFDLTQIVVYSLVLTLLSSLVALTYYYTGSSLSNRSRLAAILPLLALTTMLIISIIQASLALSLGLVGALSIVRFRAAIKDPQELAYIFLVIALGLGFGANQPTTTLVFFVIIMTIILIQVGLRKVTGRLFTERDSLHLELTFDKPQPLPQVLKTLRKHCSQAKLVRLQEEKAQTMLFIIKPKSIAALETLRHSYQTSDQGVRFSLLHYQPLS